MPEFDLFEIMRTTRSMWRLKTDPFPDTLHSRILECGTYAASGGNMQAWRFLVIHYRKTKEADRWGNPWTTA
jgi:nitroreductase